ncbi:unnamed protein product [Brachionus calyciflorus]|uniref:RRM domain-containing protein n=1 Tax=Brachionus calyciflorus TaxID=104777 RepID=A0A813MXJ5_9BILA|nr:unnamed protein product [Brachionus calyciflorus]
MISVNQSIHMNSYPKQNDMMDTNNNCIPTSNSQLFDHHQNFHQDDSILSNGGEHESNDSRTNLIVNYLPQNMTQDEIKALFSSIGTVESCKLIKDKLTGQSLGYAFVNFQNEEDSDKAVSTLNGMRLQNKTIKVSHARPSSESIKGANLYVCGLDKDFSQVDLEKMFSKYGIIISSKILTDPKTGVSKGVGFVRFDQRYEAEIAISELNGKTYENMQEPLIVKFANSPNSVKSVMGLPLAPYVPINRGFYQPYRPTTNSNYRYSPMSAYCTPDQSNLTTPIQATPLTGIITAAPTPQSASLSSSLPTTPVAPVPTLVNGQTAILTTPPTSISNTSLSSLNYSGWCIFVYNVGPETDESLLWQLFGPFGAVQNVKIIRDPQSQKCKGFGFVTMTNYEEALTAINCLNGFNLNNRILQVSFKTTTSKQMY